MENFKAERLSKNELRSIMGGTTMYLCTCYAGGATVGNVSCSQDFRTLLCCRVHWEQADRIYCGC